MEIELGVAGTKLKRSAVNVKCNLTFRTEDQSDSRAECLIMDYTEATGSYDEQVLTVNNLEKEKGFSSIVLSVEIGKISRRNNIPIIRPISLKKVPREM